MDGFNRNCFGNPDEVIDTLLLFAHSKCFEGIFIRLPPSNVSGKRSECFTIFFEQLNMFKEFEKTFCPITLSSKIKSYLFKSFFSEKKFVPSAL